VLAPGSGGAAYVNMGKLAVLGVPGDAKIASMSAK
jgi:hypothetical protein